MRSRSPGRIRCISACLAAALLLAFPAGPPLLAQSEGEGEGEVEIEVDVEVDSETQNTGVTGIMPFFWDRGEHLGTPDLSDISGITFLTDSDYPPFNYRDAGGNLVGFNVDIAKALCAALRIRCRIATRAWEELLPALDDRSADAVIASIAITQANRERVDFSYPYFRSPARFVVRHNELDETVTPEIMDDKRIAVMSGSAHEAYLKAFFSSAEIISYGDAASAREALRTGEVNALFGDGTTLMFWINGSDSNDCCRFADGVFSESHFFGNGAGIAVRLGDELLMDALNYGLDRIKISGTYDRIYRKHFPLDLY